MLTAKTTFNSKSGNSGQKAARYNFLREKTRDYIVEHEWT